VTNVNERVSPDDFSPNDQSKFVPLGPTRVCDLCKANTGRENNTDLFYLCPTEIPVAQQSWTFYFVASEYKYIFYLVQLVQHLHC
jgi:hypothetical protein